MKKMNDKNNKLDEMQELNLLTIEKNGFQILFYGLVCAIIVQYLIYQEAAMKYTAGETIILFAGGIYVAVSALRKGIWDRKSPATPTANLIASIGFSAIFAVILGIIKYIQYGFLEGAIASATVFFLYITVVCYVVLTILLVFYRKKKRNLEKEENE